MFAMADPSVLSWLRSKSGEDAEQNQAEKRDSDAVGVQKLAPRLAQENET
jgi:hypothetical protein